MSTSVALLKSAITVLDFESTGSVTGFNDEPWQIGMVTLRCGRIDPDSMFESLLRVDINRPFNVYAPGRHHLLRDALAQAPTLHALWPKISSRLTAGPLAAHNAATEKKFIRAAAPMHRLGPWIDTLTLARKAWPGCSSYALEDLTRWLNLKKRVNELCFGREAHDALYDAVAAAALLELLLAQPGWERVSADDLATN